LVVIFYLIPKERARGRKADQIPQFQRILSAGPWAVGEYSAGVHGMGTVAFWAGTEVGDLDNLQWRQCADGLLYARRGMPKQTELAKRNTSPGIDITLSTGVYLTVPIAAAAPRKVLFGSGDLGEPVTEYAKRALALFERMSDPKNKISILDPESLMVVTLAVQAAYRVTTELLDDLGWITSADIDPILCAAMGSDPKALEAADVPSSSPAAA
jgi:hypothetical protein